MKLSMHNNFKGLQLDSLLVRVLTMLPMHSLGYQTEFMRGRNASPNILRAFESIDISAVYHRSNGVRAQSTSTNGVHHETNAR